MTNSWQELAKELSGEDRLRIISIVSDTGRYDKALTRCDRHDTGMVNQVPMIRKDGGIYTSGDGISFYTCPSCLLEVVVIAPKKEGINLPDKPREELASELYTEIVTDKFHSWNDGNEVENLFKYIGKGEINTDSGMVFFE